jgi:hypothetical protein
MAGWASCRVRERQAQCAMDGSATRPGPSQAAWYVVLFPHKAASPFGRPDPNPHTSNWTTAPRQVARRLQSFAVVGEWGGVMLPA